MTWIVGTNSLFGQAILVSDICVTFTSSGAKTYLGCLQKIYPIGRFVIAGFAGSVRIGFAMIEFLKRQFATVRDDAAWNVDIVANTWWPRLARRIFRLSHEIERNCGCQIIMTTVHPTRDRGDAPWPSTDVFSFVSPGFSPRKAAQNEVLAIGSGSLITTCMEAVQDACSDFAFHSMIELGEVMQAHFVADAVLQAITTNPTPSVSHFFQVALAQRGKYAIIDREYDIYPPAKPRIEVRFPPIARNFRQFLELAKDNGQHAEGAVC